MWNTLRSMDFTHPFNVMLLAALILLPVVGGHYVQAGALMGLIQALSVLALVYKSPAWLQGIIAQHAFAADLILSTLATLGMSLAFGHGLLLAVSGITCALLLSWALPRTGAS